MWRRCSRVLVGKFGACNPQVTSSVEPVEEETETGCLSTSVTWNTKPLQGCTVHLTNTCKPLAGTAKTQPSIPKKQVTKRHTCFFARTHSHGHSLSRRSLSKFALPSHNWKPKVCQFVITSTHTHTHSSLGISMSGTAAKMTAENLGELLGLFADYLLQWRWGKDEQSEEEGGRDRGRRQRHRRKRGRRGRRDGKRNRVRQCERNRDSSEKTESRAPRASVLHHSNTCCFICS